jgi:hypothetical protein
MKGDGRRHDDGANVGDRCRNKTCCERRRSQTRRGHHHVTVEGGVGAVDVRAEVRASCRDGGGVGVEA